jgi:hypothetical protein
MIICEKYTGEEFSFPLELELVPPFSPPTPHEDWTVEENAGKQLSVRNAKTGEVRYPHPNSVWCVLVPEGIESEYMPTRSFALRHMGNWNHVSPWDDDYDFFPEDDQERETLELFGFKIAKPGWSPGRPGSIYFRPRTALRPCTPSKPHSSDESAASRELPGSL